MPGHIQMLFDTTCLSNLPQAITNLTGAPLECASLPPAWQVQRSWINDQASPGGYSVAGVHRLNLHVAGNPRCMHFSSSQAAHYVYVTYFACRSTAAGAAATV